MLTAGPLADAELPGHNVCHATDQRRHDVSGAPPLKLHLQMLPAAFEWELPVGVCHVDIQLQLRSLI
jgi:hypothetical protein